MFDLKLLDTGESLFKRRFQILQLLFGFHYAVVDVANCSVYIGVVHRHEFLWKINQLS
jgi:hypothetical protein